MRTGKAPGPFRLTEARRRILALLAQYTHLRTEDFYKLLGAKDEVQERGIRRLLRDFAVTGCVKREHILEKGKCEFLPHFQFVYLLTQKGYKLGREYGIVAKNAQYFHELPRTLAHQAEVTQFHLEVSKLPLELYWQQRDVKKTVHPDAFFTLTNMRLPEGENTDYYFLEIEKTERSNYRDGVPSILRKIRRYFEYQGTEKCRDEWGFNRFRVIIVVRTEERRQNLLGTLSDTFPYGMFWITTEVAYKQDIAEKIFLTPKDYSCTAYSFLD